jgi:hypothetical protein
MEHFNNTDSWIAMGRHELSAPVHTLDDQTKASFRLNPDGVFVVTLEGKTRPTVFEGWHGSHALFYSVRDDWRFIIHVGDLRKVVKRKKA